MIVFKLNIAFFNVNSVANLACFRSVIELMRNDKLDVLMI